MARLRPRQRKRSSSGTPTAPATSRCGSTVSPARPQPAAIAAATSDERARVLPQRRRDRKPGQVDEPVRGRDEERQVVQAVVVDAPDAASPVTSPTVANADDAERLCAPLDRDA